MTTAIGARIPLAAIVPSKTNPRKHFDQTALDELAESIKKHDVLQPILLRPNGGPDRYELVAGERRYRAAKAAGLSDIPATVRELSRLKCWKIIAIFCRAARRPAASSVCRSWPATTTRPLSGRSSRLITRNSVLLPAPDAPMIPNTSPDSIFRSTPWSAGTRRPSTSYDLCRS